MLADSHPRAFPRTPTAADDAPPVLEAPRDLVERYLELTAQRRAVEDELAHVRAELELIAAAHLKEGSDRGRFLASTGFVSVRMVPTCVFDKQAVTRELQRCGRLADVAVVTGPSLARFLAKEPVLAARLGEMVRPRRSVTLYTGSL